MKILIINTYDITGGASRAVYRLHRSLLAQDIDSEMLVLDKSSDDFTVKKYDLKIGKIKSRLRRFQYKFFNPIQNYPNKTKTFFSTSFLSFSTIVDTINEINPDIVHLHWICDEIIKIEDLAKIKAPIVWSLHDMWAFTGGCHYDEECGRYSENCGQCKVLGSTVDRDLSREIFERKEKAYAHLKNLKIIGLSQWLSECAQNSTLLKEKKHVCLPNPIDTTVFKPISKTVSRKLWNLPQDKKLILFGAMNATSDLRKGFNELLQALHQLDHDDVELVVFGSSKPEQPVDLKFKMHYLGRINDDTSLVALYSAVDVMIVPSLQENLSNAIMESLSCATPVIGFDIGGNSDLIEHKKNGYLAMPFDTKDLADGIKWVLTTYDYEELHLNARKKVLETFDSKVVAKKYIKLYKEVLDG